MEERPYRRRRGGSLVFPIILIVLGVLFLLDNLNITPGIDWETIGKLWPIIFVALGLEILLGRRVSFGAIFMIVVVFVIAGAAIWWTVIVGDGETKIERFSWSMDDYERAELVVDVGVGELRIDGQSDMADLLEANLELPSGLDLRKSFKVSGNVARGRISTDSQLFFLFQLFTQLFGGSDNDWELQLNTRMSWDLDVDSGVGDVRLDLSDLRVRELDLNSGVGSVELTLPQRGTVKAKVDGGVGDIRITIPEGAQARIRIDRGIGDLHVGNRFRRQGDNYETEGFDDAESYIDLEVDLGIGSITIR